MGSPERIEARASAAALLWCLAGCAGQPVQAVPQPGGVLRTAEQEAGRSPDPVAAKLAVWLRAQVPGAASASEIDAFLRDNPDWPSRAVLGARLQDALAVEPDDAVARRLCASHRPDGTGALLRCATALSDQSLLPPGSGAPAPPLSLSPAALPPPIQAAARAAWIGGIDGATQEAEFLRLFGQLPTAADQWQRFDRLEWHGAVAQAQRQIARLAPADMPLATTRLALRLGRDGADGLAASLHAPASADPAMLLDLARWERKHARLDAALALWHAAALGAEQNAATARRPAFWTEREALAREMLGQHRDADALFLAADTAQTEPSARLDSAFLAGWIVLRRLHQPAAAIPLFNGLTRDSHAVITTSRGFYWLGRALEEQGSSAAAADAYRQAAARPASFYGQAAIGRLQAASGVPAAGALARALDGPREPRWSQAEAIRFAGLELVRAATLLVSWNDAHHARLFLLRLDEQAGSDVEHALGAGFADRLGLPDVAVAIARRAGRHGLVLAQSGWPAPFTPPLDPPLPAGLALAVMRQESSFDPAIVSPAGARGLMQLMPATALTLSAGHPDAAALAQPSINMALGTDYLAALLGRFGGAEPYAVAAYNAGPNRVTQWLQQNGDPRLAGTLRTGDDPRQVLPEEAGPNDAMIDWIELIPFAETRNYVQRVLESQAIYRVRSGVGS